MLGKNIDENGAYWDNMGFGNTSWPACGEIDIMEHWGNNQNYVQSAIHTPSSFGNTTNLGGQFIKTASDEFHVYSLEWTSNKLVFSVDSNIHYTYEPSQKNEETWPFDSEQYLILNLAIQSSIASSFTQSELEIDYIRIYQKNSTHVDFANKSNSQILYPNPVNNTLNLIIENTTQPDLTVNIYSMDGKLMNTNSYTIQNNSIFMQDLNYLNTGVYLITYSIGNKNFRHKFIKN